ncbi:MAG: Apolipoprotein N-acyltransferase [Microgenomates group bacterium GW2011_GWB1_40_9]|uniref:CN hydrolase domain-containing protein n=1 Tax=Candidatus Zambryskibacteria bacterium RIFCSPHIGHO2_01_FULL_46_30 TaxID=1802739 RepID=A0A1G2T6W7_9BACT|nr:MAG: Apolipoprotein N-acyltransferase [Microgenomates group bacterium GW2011_GWB1_40_9]OHA92529.1 MAG: hypothetical protein A2665_00610 [Candidatus Zambryskibacteria bacterium RIFCSPHIGHO2_01_FULL_46_30]OHB06464.1 MAG: hypothetical protein A3B22_01880 [Candidatus Zambryskibacteria bacterium RIFCSPLOWO2_01_FULL_47_33]
MQIFFLFTISTVILGFSYWVEPLWVLVFFAFPPFIHGVRKVLEGSMIKILLWGMLAGALFLILGLPPLLVVESEVFQTAPAAGLMFYAGLAGFFAAASLVYGGVFGLLFALLKFAKEKISAPSLVLFVFPVLWVGAELVIRYFTFGFDWWLVGIPLIAAGPFRELATMGGVPVLSLVVVLSGSLLYAAYSFRPLIQRVTISICLLASALIAFFLYGIILFRVETIRYPEYLPPVAILQPNVKFPDVYPVENDAYYGTLIREALTRNPEIIIFPAQILSTVTLGEEISKDLWVRLIGRSLVDSNVTVIFYIPIKTEDGVTYQTMFAIKRGEVIGQYRKEVLFPVSDYRPAGFYKYLFGEPSYTISAFDKVSSKETNGLLTPDGFVTAAICNEPFSRETVRRIRRLGAPILVVSGSDRPFLSDLIFNGTLRMARLRATEADVWIFRAYKTGVSAVIAPNGEVLYRLNRNERGVIFFGEGDDGVKKFY